MSELKLGMDVELAPLLKVNIPLGGGLDLTSGVLFKGMYGETIWNAGHPFVIGMIGMGNNFKSTILDDLATQAMSRVFESCHPPEKKSQKHLSRMKTTNNKFDTEANTQEARLNMIAQACRWFAEKAIDLFDPTEMYWRVTDQTVMLGDAYFDKLKDFLAYKRKNSKAYLIRTPFLDRDGTVLMILLPTFGNIDSLTDFRTKTEDTIMDATLGHADANMLFARGGLFKTRLLGELPPLCAGAYHYMGITAQINKEMVIGGGPGGAAMPNKVLQYMPTDQKIVGATRKFTYATSLGLLAANARPLLDKDQMPLYTLPGHNPEKRDTDLNVVDLRAQRNKNGPTGHVLRVIVTQTGGIQYELTQFHYIREFPSPPEDKNKRPGVIGKGGNYTLALYPSQVITRNNVREKIEEDQALRTALWYTQEILEMSNEPRFRDIWLKYGMDLEEAYAKLVERGYDVDFILNTCRPYYLFNNEYNPRPHLSSVDLLRIAKYGYIPFWMTEDKKGIKPEYQFTAD